MDYLVQVIGSGILQGLVYALIAVSLVIIYKSSEVFNFSIGEFCTVGAVFFFLLQSLGLPLWLIIPGFLLMSALFAGLIQKLVIDRLIGRDPLSITLVTIGISTVLIGLLLVFFGENPEIIDLTLPDVTFDLGGALFISTQVWNGIIASVALIGLLLFYKFTTMGILMRATADSQIKSIVLGINARWILTLTWAISGMMAALGGLAVSNGSAVSYDMGIVGMAAIPVVLLGGLESIPGAILGGVIIGLVETTTIFYLEPWLDLPGFQAITPYIVLLIVLMIRPQGLFGQEMIERV
ncbi:branched-chain amino acid ABC transporter permease [bacterium]|nr:branched-chain amino acid ABC transporter permease [bacterium]